MNSDFSTSTMKSLLLAAALVALSACASSGRQSAQSTSPPQAELSGRQRQDARPGHRKMYTVPCGRAWWPAVGAPLERGVRRRHAVTTTARSVGLPQAGCSMDLPGYAYCRFWLFVQADASVCGPKVGLP